MAYIPNRDDPLMPVPPRDELGGELPRQELQPDPELAEAALSHATGNAVTRAYARSDLFERRRVLMDAWATYATGTAGQVVQLVRA